MAVWIGKGVLKIKGAKGQDRFLKHGDPIPKSAVSNKRLRKFKEQKLIGTVIKEAAPDDTETPPEK